MTDLGATPGKALQAMDGGWMAAKPQVAVLDSVPHERSPASCCAKYAEDDGSPMKTWDKAALARAH
eukprot:10374438-Lingulodinium_polyedra.AAC.1